MAVGWRMWIHAYLRFTMVARNKCIRYDEVAEAFFSCGPEDTQVWKSYDCSGTVQPEAIEQGILFSSCIRWGICYEE